MYGPAVSPLGVSKLFGDLIAPVVCLDCRQV
jgi:hypothetical protein